MAWGLAGSALSMFNDISMLSLYYCTSLMDTLLKLHPCFTETPPTLTLWEREKFCSFHLPHETVHNEGLVLRTVVPRHGQGGGGAHQGVWHHWCSASVERSVVNITDATSHPHPTTAPISQLLATWFRIVNIKSTFIASAISSHPSPVAN